MNELIDVTRQLALVARAGLPFQEALQNLPPDATRFLGPARDLDRGDTLSLALARYPRAFSPFYVNMVEAAEASERPGGVLAALSRWLEASDRLETQIRVTLLYPYLLANALGVFVMTISWLAFYALATVKVPAALGLVGLAWLLAVNLAATTGHGRQLARLVPGLTRLRRLAQEALWVRALGSLLAAGVPLPRALELAGGVVWEPDLQAVATSVKRGTALEKAGEGLEPVVRWALQRGREELMLFAADHLEAEVERSTRLVLRSVASAAVAILGLLVLGSVVAFWVPFYSQIGPMGEPNGIIVSPFVSL